MTGFGTWWKKRSYAKVGRRFEPAKKRQESRNAKNHRRRPASNTFIFWPLPNDWLLQLRF
jgi:hypothetical protein